MESPVASHDVVLIAPNGREQPAALHITKRGISLATADKELSQFPFEVIVKWLPSHQRSRNPGAADCLDLQIQTAKGPRDLRMRCGSEAAVTAVMYDIQATVQEVTQEEGSEETSASHLAQHSVAEPQVMQELQTQSAHSDNNLQPLPTQAATPLPAAAAAIPVRILGGQQPFAAVPGPSQQLPLVTMAVGSAQQQQQQGSVPGMPLAAPYAALHYYHSQQQPPLQAQPLLQQASQTMDASNTMSGQYPINLFQQAAGAQFLGPVVAGGSGAVLGMPGGGGWPNTLLGNPAMGGDYGLPSEQLYGKGQGTAGDEVPHLQSEGDELSVHEALQASQAREQALVGDVEELHEQNKFLEGLVKRLAAEVSRRQLQSAETGQEQDPCELALGLPEDAGVPLPPWLRDRRYLNPLLAAYDERIAALEKQLSQRAGRLDSLQRQVEEVVTENDRLRVELELREQASLQAPGSPGGSAGPQQQAAQERLSLLLDENALLRWENDMLLAQQSNLEAELQRLHRSMEEQTLEAVAAARESASATSRVHAMEESAAARVQAVEQAALDRVAQVQQAEAAAEEAAKSLKAKLSRCQASLRAAESRAFELEQEVQASQSRLEDEAASASVARRALEDSREQCAAQAAELSQLSQRCRAAVEGQATLQVELTSVREKYEEAAAEVAATHRQLEALMSAVNSLEQRVTEYQRNDAEVYSRIRDAMEEAEQARLARDSAVMVQQELQREVEVLKDRLVTMRQVTRDAAYAELQGQLHESAERLRLAQDGVSANTQQAAELRASNERLQREVRSLNSELTAFQANLQSGDAGRAVAPGAMAGAAGGKVQVSLMSLAAMEQLQDLERSRDEATQKLESTERQLERLSRNWRLERQALEVEGRELRQKLADAEGLLLARQNDITGLSRQVDGLTRELQAAAASRGRFEEDARMQAAAIRSERDQEVRSLASKLESAVAAADRSLSEAERMLGAKEVLLAQWREEAQTIAERMDKATTEYRRRLAEQDSEAAALSHQIECLQGQNLQLVAELDEARAAGSQLQAQLGEAESRGAAIGMQLLAAQFREEELQQELRSMDMALERVRAVSTRDARQVRDASRDKLLTKYAAWKQTASGSGVSDIL